MVLHKQGEKLYSGLVTTLTNHLKEISQPIEVAHGGLFLEELNRKWGEHTKALQIEHLFPVTKRHQFMN